MDRPRVALGLEASRATLNHDVCAEMGGLLSSARHTLGLDVNVVAGRLLLSPRQVKALELADQDAFYGADFYAAALKKYAALLGVTSELADRARVCPSAALPPPMPRGRSAPLAGIPRPRGRALIGVGLALTGAVTWLLAWAVHSAPSSRHVQQQEPAATSDRAQDPVPVPQPVSGAPAAADAPPVSDPPVAESAPTLVPARVDLAAASAASIGPPIGRVHVTRSTWVFVRYSDNSTVERGLGPGDEFLLHRPPIYLAVGAADGADVVIAGRRLDNAQFTTNGQLRVGAAYLTALASP